ncbi:MAG: outer membrane protein transport protein [Deltaproteobacteria bacterium]|nr:outer membrane protein transport protein [Deltaproteobacteria bacterium]
MLKIRWVFGAFLLVQASQGLADDANYQNYVVGERAAGMGGAYTAFSESAEGTLYNPGGIVFSKESQISLSANIARWTQGTIENGITIDSLKKDLDLSALQVIPASSVALRVSKESAMALSFYTPDSISYAGDEELVEGGIDALLSYRVNDSLLLAGPSYSLKINETLGVGGSLFYAYRRFLRETFIIGSTATAFQQVFSKSEYNYGGLLAILGAKWRMSPVLDLGFAVRSVSWRLHGAGESLSSTTTEAEVSATNPSKTVLEDLEVDLPLPWKFTLGIGYHDNQRFSVGGDVSLYLPNDFAAVHDPQGRASDAFIKQELTVNGNVGMEYRFRPLWSFRGGLFTNFSSAPDVEVGGSTTQIDYYGGVASVAYERAHYTTQFGVQTAYGSGDTLVSSEINDLSLLHVTVMIATSFRF